MIAVDAERLGPPLGRDFGDPVVMDLMIDDIDIVRSLVDSDVDTVSASTSELPYTTATLEFENDVVGTLTASRITQNKVRELTIHARECVVSVDYIEQSVEIHRQSMPEYVEVDGDVRYRHEGIVERPVVEDGEPLKKELVAFVDAAESGDEPPVTADDGLRAVELAKTIKTSTE